MKNYVLFFSIFLIPFFARAATFEVTNLDDSGEGSFRQALIDANVADDADTITFASGLTGTITVESNLPEIITNLAVTGPGAEDLTIDANGNKLFVITLDTVATVTTSFSGLTVTGSDDVFGPFSVDNGSTLEIDQCIITENQATAGGAIATGNATVLVTNSLISNNTVTGSGGVFVSEGTPNLTIVNSTLSNNEAGDNGGAIFFNPGALNLANVTIAGNTAGQDGGGVYLTTEGGASVIQIKNTLIAGNTSTTTDNNDCGNDTVDSATIVSLGYNLIQDPGNCVTTGDLSSTDQDGVDPLIGDLAANGSILLTHALGAESPAIDAGNPDGCTDFDDETLATDQRGASRVDGCDIGAFEYGEVCGNGFVDGTDECDDGNDVDDDDCSNTCEIVESSSGSSTTTSGSCSVMHEASGLSAWTVLIGFISFLGVSIFVRLRSSL